MINCYHFASNNECIGILYIVILTLIIFELIQRLYQSNMIYIGILGRICRHILTEHRHIELLHIFLRQLFLHFVFLELFLHHRILLQIFNILRIRVTLQGHTGRITTMNPSHTRNECLAIHCLMYCCW